MGVNQEDEIDDIAAEIEKGCGGSEDCFRQFTTQEILDFKLGMRKLSKGERDLFLMGKLDVSIRDPTTVTNACSKKAVKKQRMHAFDHRLVCQNAFGYIHEIGNFTLR